jgi:energy-converting hydrogenase Eha subunit F
MYQPEDNFDIARAQNSTSEPNLNQINANLSPENVAVRKKQLEKIFLKLIAIGLAIGAILGIGTYYLLNKLGLNKKPYQIEQKKQQQQQAPFEQISVFPELPESWK